MGTGINAIVATTMCVKSNPRNYLLFSQQPLGIYVTILSTLNCQAVAYLIIFKCVEDTNILA